MESVIWKKIFLPPSLWVIRSSCVQFTAFHIKGRIHGFTGTVQILCSRPCAVCVSSAYATSEPGARAAWHTHPLGQALIITVGVGRGQGGPTQEVHPGGAVWFLRAPNTGTEPRPASPCPIFRGWRRRREHRRVAGKVAEGQYMGNPLPLKAGDVALPDMPCAGNIFLRTYGDIFSVFEYGMPRSCIERRMNKKVTNIIV